MHIANDPEVLRNLLGQRPVRLALGNFDGLHQGHRRLLKGLVEQTSAKNEASVVVTFTPHPAQYFARNHAFKKIDTPLIQRRILRDEGVSGLLELSFNEQMAAMSGDDFIKKILGVLPLREVVVGADFRFGHDRSCGLDTLKRYGEEMGFKVSAIAIVELDDAPVSSSRIRHVIAEDGNMQSASKLLGRPYCLEGQVSDGQKLGRSLGFPTANIESVDQIIPKTGVYAGSLSVVSTEGFLIEHLCELPCVVNIGIRPTVTNETRMTIEAHVYGPKGENLDLYHKTVHLKFLKRLRNEKRFESLDDLKRQIAKDIEEAQK
jgi:riboflavin kinase/FMN adenylyltransferase